MKKFQAAPERYQVPALDKGLDILETLASSPVPRSLSELARALNRTSSELFRMLNALEKRGYLERDPISSKYGLTLKLYEMAHTHSPMEKLLRAVTLPMRALAERIKESCHVSKLNHGRLIVLGQADSPGHYRFSVEVGSVYSPIHTASGRLLLAYLQEEEFQRFCSASVEYRKLDSTARRALLARLAEIRRKGISTTECEPVIGVKGYAVLIGKPEVNVTAALSVASLDMRGKKHNVEEIIRGLKETAQEINRATGLGA
ncbi:MAG: IclR family transcriptional regulator [Terriglobia bacterium]